MKTITSKGIAKKTNLDIKREANEQEKSSVKNKNTLPGQRSRWYGMNRMTKSKGRPFRVVSVRTRPEGTAEGREKGLRRPHFRKGKLDDKIFFTTFHSTIMTG